MFGVGERMTYKIRGNDPNILMNKLIFHNTPDRKNRIEGFCQRDIYRKQLAIDFNLLIPQPNYLYRGLHDGSKDFIRETDWNLNNWGTFSNAFNGAVTETKDEITIYFEIEFELGVEAIVPYPIIVAICNLVDVPFTYLYYARNEAIWGFESYGQKDTCPRICISRLNKRLKNEEDLLGLRKEFLTTDELIEILAKERCKKCHEQHKEDK